MEKVYNVMAHILETVSRTGYDRDFREQFLVNPRQAFEAEGITVPDNMEIVLIMDEPTRLNILVPPFDDQLVEVNPDHPLLRE